MKDCKYYDGSGRLKDGNCQSCDDELPSHEDPQAAHLFYELSKIRDRLV